MFFYDSQLGLYINDTPLLVSAKVLEAANKIGIEVKWNAKGYICGITHKHSLSLAKQLGSTTLSVQEFMHLAKREPRVASNEFAEWLRDTYTVKDEVMYDANGDVAYTRPARPGWFDLEDIDHRGLPRRFVERSADEKWKFWTLHHPELKAGAMRSYVASSGTCSLDLGIPEFAQHPNIMIREAYHGEPGQPALPFDNVWQTYQDLVLQHSRNDAAIEELLGSLSDDDLRVEDNIDQFVVDKHAELTCDLRGKRDLLANKVKPSQIISYEDLVAALSLSTQSAVGVVMGHPHPDADSIVSAVFEAVRRTTLNPHRPYAAFAESVPAEVALILGPNLTEVLESSTVEPHHEVVLVDCQGSPHAQKNLVKAVIDHHPITTDFPHYVARSQESSWSSTLQVYFKYLGCGFDLDAEAAKVLAEATLIEAEPELMEKMSRTDKLAMDRLRSIAAPMRTYSELMATMTDETDLDARFMKDYKEASYGFAVIKGREHSDFRAQAMANNAQRQLPLTVVKQVIYDDDFQQVTWESIGLVFNDSFHDNGFQQAVLDTLVQACTAFHGDEKVSHRSNLVEVKNGGTQTPRLLLLPLIEQLVQEHLRFVYSHKLSKYISCGFYTGPGDGELYSKTSQELTVQAKLSFTDVQALLSDAKETSFLTLSEFWQVYKEFQGNARVISSLTDPKFVELLDTEIINGNQTPSLVYHHGIPEQLSFQRAEPALLHPSDIGPDGLPTRLISPDTYGDNTLWRYWTPDSNHNVATRGHIFLLKQSCIDLKISPTEKTKCLTFRPTYKNIPDLKYDVVRDRERWVKLEISPRLFNVR